MMVHRFDIDYIRAVSIISVLLFHAFPKTFPHGFVGVDSFFVISGFLIAEIIFSNYRQPFFYLNFLASRINRLFPAMIFFYIFVTYFSLAILDENELRNFKSHLFATGAFFENFKLASEVGYFDTDSYTKPLMHMWSLSVEVQYYVFFTILLLICLMYRVASVRYITVYVIMGWVFYLLVAEYTKIDTFYNPFFRFWEFSLGSLVAAATRIKPVAGSTRIILGLILTPLILSGFTFDAPPFFYSSLAVSSTALVIYYGASFKTEKFLGSFLYMGKISYPCYLIHWPLISFACILTGNQPSAQLMWFVLFATLLIATCVYLLIESPIKLIQYRKTKAVVLLSIYILVSFFSLRALATDYSEPITHPCVLNNLDPKFFRDCIQDNKSNSKVLLLGDSKAQAAYRGFFFTSPDNIGWIYIGGPGGQDFKYPPPRPLLDSDADRELHPKSVQVLVEAIRANPSIKYIVFVSAIRNMIMQGDGYRYQRVSDFDLSRMQIEALNFARLSVNSGKKLIIVYDVPWLPDPKECIPRQTKLNYINKLVLILSKRSTQYLNKNCILKIEDYIETRRQYYRIFDLAAMTFPKDVYIVDPTDIFCDFEIGSCSPYKNEILLYSYTDHMSLDASIILGARVNSLIRKLDSEQ